MSTPALTNLGGTAPCSALSAELYRGDPVRDPDPVRAANAAATASLLRCWVREAALARPADDVLRLRLTATGVRVEAPVLYWSATGWHRFGHARVLPLPGDDEDAPSPANAGRDAARAALGRARADEDDGVSRDDGLSPSGFPRLPRLRREGAPLTAAGLAALLVREVAARGQAPHTNAAEPADPAVLRAPVVRLDDVPALGGAASAARPVAPDALPAAALPAAAAGTAAPVVARSDGGSGLGGAGGSAAVPVAAASGGGVRVGGAGGAALESGAGGGPWAGGGSWGGAGVVGADAEAELVARVIDSAAHTARFLAVRRAEPQDPAGTTPFLASEQALILGHPLHPVPKSREGLTFAEAAAYSPELRGAFPLHWFAADPSVVSSDWAPRDGRTAAGVVARLAGSDLQVPPGMVAVPAHPWQARALVSRPAVAALLDTGLLRDLGPSGPEWSPTSSLRTVYRADQPVMLKLSLGLRITNSRRENLRKELRRGAEVYRLLAAGLGAELTAAHPGFDIVRDPGWLAVDRQDAAAGRPDSGLDVVLRENRFGRHDLVRCVAGLVAERPGDGTSLLAQLIRGLALRARRDVADVAREWFGRYLESVAAPVLWLYATHGIALEAHQQNTLVALNPGGWPVGGRYRDNQGYYFAESRAADLARWLPHAGEDGDSIVADAVVDERLGYYLGVNNVLGLVGALGSQGLADEDALLGDVRALLARFAAGPRVPGVVPALLDSATLRCKANLLTRVNGLDELVEPLATQSVYVEIPNPLAGRR